MPSSQQPNITKLFLKRTIPAPCEQVFEAWTNPEEIKKWFSPGPMNTLEAHVDLRVGGTYRIVMRDDVQQSFHIAVGSYREINPPQRLVFTWAWEGDPTKSEMLVTLEFYQKGNATELTLIHELFPSEESKNIHAEGWVGCLDKLAQLFTT